MTWRCSNQELGEIVKEGAYSAAGIRHPEEVVELALKELKERHSGNKATPMAVSLKSKAGQKVKWGKRGKGISAADYLDHHVNLTLPKNERLPTFKQLRRKKRRDAERDRKRTLAADNQAVLRKARFVGKNPRWMQRRLDTPTLPGESLEDFIRRVDED